MKYTLLKFLSKIGPSYIYGFSLGGYIAIAAAQIDESNIKGIVTQGTKLDWTVENAKKETTTLTVDFLQSKAEGFYNYLVALHGEYLPQLLRSEEHTSELQSRPHLVCRLLLEKKKKKKNNIKIQT